MASGEVSPRWSTAAVALGMVAILTALGVLLGSVLQALVRAYGLGMPHGVMAAAMAIVGFGLGWWWFATVGRGWIAADMREAELEQQEEE